MKYLMLFSFLISAFTACGQSNSQKNAKPANPRHIGGPCEGCEAIYESPIPFEKLPPVDTLPGFDDAGPKLEISGTVYQPDGKTPARDVVIYVYHTDRQGIYARKGGETGWGKRHGYIRGWIKTDEQGRYRFYTIRPGSYPNSNNPQHIHVTIKEPGKNEYWIDEFHFEDDPLFTKEVAAREQQRGGSGVIRLKEENGVFKGKRDIILGMNIPDYPVSR